MRELNANEMIAISGGFSSADFSYVMDKTVGYGATGVLAKMVLHGVSWACFSEGLLIGAGVGAAYGLFTVTAHALKLY